jgi:hypothetical protein
MGLAGRGKGKCTVPALAPSGILRTPSLTARVAPKKRAKRAEVSPALRARDRKRRLGFPKKRVGREANSVDGKPLKNNRFRRILR